MTVGLGTNSINGTGGTSSFGALMQVTGASYYAPGAATFPPGEPNIYHANNTILFRRVVNNVVEFWAPGNGGAGGFGGDNGAAGENGVVLVEW